MKLAATVLSIVVAASGCAKKETQGPSGEAAAAPRGERSEGDPGSEPVTTTSTSIARRPIVYLHGMCSDPQDDLAAWGDVAKRYGAVVVVMGDVPCPQKPGRLQWSTNADAIDAKIDGAVKAAGLDPTDMIVIGESMGAARAELIATKFPDKYSRLVLVGSPQTPSPQNLKGAKAVANLAGEKEQQSTMKQGTRALESAGTPTRFWELPEATHGNYGPEGERIMNEALGFVASR